METRDRAALNDLLRLLDGPAKALGAEGARLRWTTVPGLALILARWANEGGRLRTLWVDAPSETEAQALAHDLAVLLPDAGVAYFPGFAPFAGGGIQPTGHGPEGAPLHPGGPGGAPGANPGGHTPRSPGEAAPSHLVREADLGDHQGHRGASGAIAGNPDRPRLPPHGSEERR